MMRAAVRVRRWQGNRRLSNAITPAGRDAESAQLEARRRDQILTGHLSDPGPDMEHPCSVNAHTKKYI